MKNIHGINVISAAGKEDDETKAVSGYLTLLSDPLALLSVLVGFSSTEVCVCVFSKQT